MYSFPRHRRRPAAPPRRTDGRGRERRLVWYRSMLVTGRGPCAARACLGAASRTTRAPGSHPRSALRGTWQGRTLPGQVREARTRAGLLGARWRGPRAAARRRGRVAGAWTQPTCGGGSRIGRPDRPRGSPGRAAAGGRGRQHRRAGGGAAQAPAARRWHPNRTFHHLTHNVSGGCLPHHRRHPPARRRLDHRQPRYDRPCAWSGAIRGAAIFVAECRATRRARRSSTRARR